jgi:transposase-like protein
VFTLTAPESAHDHCPLCQADLGKARGATRRQIVFTATPGTFRWRCPDCRGVWQVNTRVPTRA